MAPVEFLGSSKSYLQSLQLARRLRKDLQEFVGEGVRPWPLKNSSPAFDYSVRSLQRSFVSSAREQHELLHADLSIKPVIRVPGKSLPIPAEV